MSTVSDLVTGVAAPRAEFAPLLRRGFSAHALLLSVALGYVLVLSAFGLSGVEALIGLVTFSVPVALLSLVLFLFGSMVVIDRPDRPARVLWRRFKGVLSSPERMARGLPLFTALIIFMYGFTVFKANITTFIPFAWDETLDRWDMALHFGYRPHELLQPILGFPLVTWLLNVNYNMWFFVMNMFWVYYAFLATPGVERTRFFLSFMLTWILGGTLLAILMSSAGPCYLTRLGVSPDPYAPLMTYLNHVHDLYPLWAIDTQNMLWDFRSEGSVFGGVSAMPSMHNATALLFVLAVWNKGRILRGVMIAHALLVLIASVHLGWHYAVDGYIAWPIAFGLWMLSGRIARWWESRPQVSQFNAEVAHV
ncbi:phosphatase PAP2 family protein [Aestuariivirga sp.]|uniref:phosphatase PAP2 family protein n=1 Tax=Aestuariivirga sp. TaxID=2650926 RepID=UPI0039E350C1